MATPFSSLLFDNPRAQRQLHWGQIFAQNLWGIAQVSGNAGDYYDFLIPERPSMYDLPQCPIFVSGRTDAVCETDGVWFTQDSEHPSGNLLLPDGTVGPERLDRSGGLHRFFLYDNTERMCMYPVNDKGLRTYAMVDFKYFFDENEVLVPQGGLFVLSIGTGTAAGAPIQGVHATLAISGPQTVVLDHGARGALVWVRS